MAVGSCTFGSRAKTVAVIPLGYLIVDSNALSASTTGKASGFAVPSILPGSSVGIAKMVSELVIRATIMDGKGSKKFLGLMAGILASDTHFTIKKFSIAYGVLRLFKDD